jgi:hypothetical protein
MADDATAPLLASSDRPSSRHSHHSDESHENTPLLLRTDSHIRYDGSEEHANGRVSSPAARSLRSLQNGDQTPGSKKEGSRWPTFIAVAVLGLIIIGIILGAFFAPAAVEEYAKQALVIEPTNLSIANFTNKGVTARVQANFRMDALRVKNEHIRNVGRFGTWLAHQVESEESKVQVYLPEYGNILIGTAVVPKLVVNIRNGHTTAIDFLTDLEPGDVEGIRRVANDWLEGRLDQIRLLGKADVGLKSGLISLGSQTISESLVFEGQSLYRSFASVMFGEKSLG